MVRIEVGTRLQRRYQIERPLGPGGMATTYLVRDMARRERVALKLVKAPSREILEAFRHEFTLLTRITHPHLVGVYDFGTTTEGGEAAFFYTAEFVEGQPLDQFSRDMSWEEVAKPVADALDALAFLHKAGIRHGDIKPDNIMVTSSGRGVLIDLGCAHSSHFSNREGLFGTFAYMAPEIIESNPDQSVYGPRADLYSFGITLKEIFSYLEDEPPHGIMSLTSKLTHRDPRQRPASAEEVLDLLGIRRDVPSFAAPPHLLGRVSEVERFNLLLEAFQRGEPEKRVLSLHGPSGVGRSRMLRELIWRSQLCGIAVVEGLPSEPSQVSSALRRAIGKEEISLGLTGVLQARDGICEGAEPLVLAFDDIHRLDEEQRSLFDALLRLSEPDDSLLILCTTTHALPSIPTVEHIELAPLEERDIRIWAEPFLSAHLCPQLFRITGGFPALIEATLSQVQSGNIHEDRIGELEQYRELPLGLIASVDSLTEAQSRALGVISIHHGHSSRTVLDRFNVNQGILEHLHQQGWVVPDGTGWKLCREAEGPSILGALSKNLVEEIWLDSSRFIREELDRTDDPKKRSALAAELVQCLVHIREDQKARELLLDFDRQGHALRAWCRAADSVASLLPSADVLICQAAIHCEAGSPDRGLQILVELLASQPDSKWQTPLRIEIARCYLRLGAPKRCLRQLRRLAEARNPWAADVEARALMQIGDARAAFDRAQEGLRRTNDARALAALHESVGVAASYLGDGDAAAHSLREAESVQRQLGEPRALVRLLSSLAIAEYRRGNAASSVTAYEQAMTTAEAHGLSDLVATLALNLGTAVHQQGDWGRALDCYRRGLRIAVALGTRGIATALRCNLAQLYADIGAFDRSEALLATAEEDLDGQGHYVGATLCLRATLEAVQGASEQGRSKLDQARSLFEDLEATRELAEIAIQRAEIALDEGLLDISQDALNEASPLVEKQEAEDLWARFGLMKGRLALAQGEGDEALRELERALHRAVGVEQRALEAACEEDLSRAYRERGTQVIAARHLRRARELWESIAATLPKELHDAFWRHPNHTTEVQLAPIEPRHDTMSSALNVERLLDIYRQLASSVRLDDVLRCTLDAAIELTGAERGFLILREEGRYDVPLARNLDREMIGKSHLKFSKSIAEQVIETNTPILTVDALADSRFRTNASVHAMRLRSVVSVPICSSESVLGALYLDNRFEKGRFRAEDLNVLTAFAYQAALAIKNARLVADLEERTAQLEKERHRVDALVKAQAEHIERLNEGLRRRSKPEEYRYDFSQIIGRSESMLEVLSILDRVIDSELPVLLQGESGTGKEVIAGAIHSQGPRQDGPFVVVDCASLPENLLEAELFGHLKGAFTDAGQDRTGLLVQAHGGTLFLDEIGEIPLPMQAKLLRVLEEREVRPLGSTQMIPIDVRLVCATNRSLAEEVNAGRFREDLYYRVVVVEVTLPPLRERIEDLPALTDHLLLQLAQRRGGKPPKVTASARRKLARYRWPGNVRQLRNVLSKALVFADDTINPGDIHLPEERREKPRQMPKSRTQFEVDESDRIQGALYASAWNVAAAARSLGIPRSTFYRKLQKYGFSK